MSTPIRRLEMPRVAAADEAGLEHHLARLLRHQIPAFVISRPWETPPSTTENAAEELHTNRLDRIAAALCRLHGVTEGVIWYDFGMDEFNQGPDGPLHSDVVSSSYAPQPTDSFTEPEVHTTTSGGGRAHVAYLGTDPVRAYFLAQNGGNHMTKFQQNFRAGQVDPDIMNPDVYTADLRTGDSVVQAGCSGRWATWHAFDTIPELGERTAQIGWFAWGNNSKRGLDLAAV